MPGQDAIEAEGRVIAVLPQMIFRVELPNRHCIMAHVSKKLRTAAASLAVGDRVKLEMTPYDFSQGRIAAIEKQIL